MDADIEAADDIKCVNNFLYNLNNIKLLCSFSDRVKLRDKVAMIKYNNNVNDDKNKKNIRKKGFIYYSKRKSTTTTN